MGNRASLPDFLIAGAMRSGTTSLYRYLGAHPAVFMAPKELGYFTDNFPSGPDWYRAQFASARPGQLLGDATADYLARGSAMKRIAETSPDVKLVASLRNPVERAWSHYLLLAERGREERSFATAITEEMRLIEQQGDKAHGAFYLYHGLYDSQLERAIQLLGRDQVHVVVFERMIADPSSTYRSLCSFLDIDPDFQPDNLGTKVNPYVTFRSLRLRRLSQRLPGPAQRPLARLNTRRQVAPPRLDQTQRDRLDSFFAPRVERVTALLEDTLPEWASPS